LPAGAGACAGVLASRFAQGHPPHGKGV
jgi:hypothetical protein